MLDLPYEEDSRADTDMNVVMTGAGGFVEVQGTAEQAPFSREELDELLDLASSGISGIHDAQRLVLATLAESSNVTTVRPRHRQSPQDRRDARGPRGPRHRALGTSRPTCPRWRRAK